MPSFTSYEQAAIRLILEGYTRKPSAYYGEIFTKPSFADDWHGGYETVAIAVIRHNAVDPAYQEADYFTVDYL